MLFPGPSTPITSAIDTAIVDLMTLRGASAATNRARETSQDLRSLRRLAESAARALDLLFATIAREGGQDDFSAPVSVGMEDLIATLEREAGNLYLEELESDKTKWKLEHSTLNKTQQGLL